MSLYKTEVDKMKAEMGKQQKYTAELKKKCGQNDITIYQLLEDKTKLVQEVSTLSKQKEQLANLCRALQAQNKSASPQPAAADVSTPSTTSSNTSESNPTPSNSESNSAEQSEKNQKSEKSSGDDVKEEK
eukprot:TRINITY_DN5143_c0_g1_i1.p1 TRINITY_DN5143_c0_g1~~TRINITY_DN5143_c0_g1_i1.p1  ORF type:complete len:130 (+),score=53.51 TRINITY_DN5143_c0_g1_i1:133-522(+)